MEKEIVLTPEGKKKLEEELEYLETVRRDEVGERIRIAREFGDISENSEFDDAKNEQAQLENRISEINATLANAVIAESSKRSAKVGIGNTVTVNMDGKERVFTIVGAAEAEPSEGRISNDSPVGAGLLGSKKGETVVVEGPTGRRIELEILKIQS